MVDGLKQNLLEWNFKKIRQLGKAFQPQLMTKVLPKLSKLYEDVAPAEPENFDPEVTYKAIVREFASNGNLNSLAPQYLRQAPWVLFYELKKQTVLGKNPKIVSALLQTLRNKPRSGPIISLWHVFLRDYPTDWQTFESIRIGVKDLLKCQLVGLRKARLREDNFHLLDKNGPERMAKLIYESDRPILDIYEEAGLVNELARGLFAKVTFSEIFGRLRNGLENGSVEENRLTRVFKYAREGDRIRIEGAKGELAEALLEPFIEDTPPENLKKAIQSFLLDTVGDPRISKGAWQGIGKQAQNVLYRWLVGASLKQFFNLLDETAQQHMWRYRHVFWDAYYKNGFVKDAWVALGSHASARARYDKTGSYEQSATLGGSQGNQSVLFMKIGSITITEWSHSGKCRIYKNTDSNKPELYQGYYHAQRLRLGGDFEVTHHGSESGKWQKTISDKIYNETGALISYPEYMPEGERDGYRY
ncbi:MAG: hypothetical protein KJ970_15800 [Candidatus Eisenbacteria bacterium]|uniref:Zorya protein ZorC EH domain-containing protein n=1 Tax=Eiseniibacteriota bacterium TaxID=2212470 RepID=A0A948RZB5_UNCEI|nr:hypothetical protein [Candidatus Eisenbacteria bacterium]MBU1949121.1 hypothetical protein [Candidatus Eisenbacteria bacterium]MBU2692387.1 hypothetical protein [Candidatus Eisenbacteria bacterium]